MLLLMGFILSVLTAYGQEAQMPEGALQSLEYTIRGTMAGYEYEAHVELLKNGKVKLCASRESYMPPVEKTVDKSVLDSLRTIMETEKMYAYQSYYTPPYQVLDGHSWSFFAFFEGGKYIDSGGSNEWPEGEGLSKIQKYIASLLEE